MSSIQKFIEKVCVQTCVYWGSPVNNGQGGKTFAPPVEIKCRWEDVVIVVSDKKGDAIESRARVLLTQDVDEEGFLYLGHLDTILDSLESSDAYVNPIDVVGAYEIKRFVKVPEIKSEVNFVRTAYLGDAFI